MDALLLCSRLLLAAVFLVAGLAKLADRTRSGQTLIDFGVPARLATPLGLLLPLTELAVAAALLFSTTAWWGGLGALALLLLFVAAIGLNLARGRRPDCRCFGQVHSAPVGRSTLIRNGLLAAVAALLVWQGRVDPGASVAGPLGDLTPGQAAAVVVGMAVLGLLAVGTWLLLQLLRQHGRLLLRIEALEARLGGGMAPTPSANGGAAAPPQGLPLGAPAPSFNLPELAGERVTLDTLRAGGKPVLLLFTDPGCGPCNALIPDIGRWRREHADHLSLAVISRGSAKENGAEAAEHELGPILLQRDYEVAESYQAYGTPSAVLVRPDGTVGSPVAAGPEAIRSLVAHTGGPTAGRPWSPPILVPMANGHAHAHHPAAPLTPKVGEPAPALALPDLDGRTVDLADFRGSTTLVLFWNPGCSFCQRMLPDLKAWEADPPAGAPRLLVVSTGTVEENRALGLRSPVMLDQDFGAGRAYGANGTPMAVLVDAEGKLASPVAAGAPAVLALAGGGAETRGHSRSAHRRSRDRIESR